MTSETDEHQQPWEDEEPTTLIQRVDRLEDLVAEIHVSEPDDEELSAAIEQLGVKATELAAALLAVDRTQREVMRLRSDVKSVRNSAATKVQVREDMNEMDKDYTHKLSRLRAWLFSAVVLAIIFLGGLLFVFSAYAADRAQAQKVYAATNKAVCEARDQQAKVMTDFLNVQIERVNASTTLTEEQKVNARAQYQALLKAFPSVDCAVLEQVINP